MKNKAARFILICLSIVGLGFLVRGTYALAPIHEFGHVLAAVLCGGSGRITSWIEAYIEPINTFTICGGYYFELIFYACIAILMAEKHPYWSSFAVGVLPANMLWALSSKDLLSEIQPNQVYNVSVTWLMINLLVLTAVAIVYIVSIGRRARLIASKRGNKRTTAFITPSEKVVSSLGR